jgi:hypothetical protein
MYNGGFASFIAKTRTALATGTAGASAVQLTARNGRMLMDRTFLYDGCFYAFVDSVFPLRGRRACVEKCLLVRVLARSATCDCCFCDASLSCRAQSVEGLHATEDGALFLAPPLSGALACRRAHGRFHERSQCCDASSCDAYANLDRGPDGKIGCSVKKVALVWFHCCCVWQTDNGRCRATERSC